MRHDTPDRNFMLDRSLHPNSRAMLNAWRRLAHPAHEDGLDEAAAPAELLSHLFVLHRAADGGWAFRNAGVRLNTLTGRTLQDRDFINLWREHDRSRVGGLLASVALEREPGVIQARGETLTGQTVELEISLAPLAQASDPRTVKRMLGLYQVLGPAPRFDQPPIWRHSVRAVLPAARLVRRPHLQLVVSNG